MMHSGFSVGHAASWALLSLLFPFGKKKAWTKALTALSVSTPSPPQVWWTGRCWSRWREATACPARRVVPSPFMRWWSCAGRRSPTRGQPSSTCSPSWRTISPPQSHSINLEKTYSQTGLFCVSLHPEEACLMTSPEKVDRKLPVTQTTTCSTFSLSLFFLFPVSTQDFVAFHNFVLTYGTTQVLDVWISEYDCGFRFQRYVSDTLHVGFLLLWNKLWRSLADEKPTEKSRPSHSFASKFVL